MKGKSKILIVEDNKSLQESLWQKLKQLGYEVFIASDGEEGLALSLEQKPDLILLDILMPKMNGDEMLEKLREDSWGKKANVLILTNVGDDDDMMQKISSYNPSYYLLKANNSLDELTNKIKELL